MSHHRLPLTPSMQTSDSVKIMLWPHRLCTEGDGHRPGSCSARRQLLGIARQAGWPWIDDLPDNSRVPSIPGKREKVIMDEPAQILGVQGNYSLVRWEGRRFPGLSIQGDSLHILRGVLEEAESELTCGSLEDALFAVREALDTVIAMDLSYQEMMGQRNLPLPYFY
ncbi:hypothetical protein ABZ412_08875 [Nocardia sp. NPDC005746]|uniref:DUF6959 family protein n=1 Tax=Nocardia sp. NPDC005746 TaxID=3157062 RepID=UPI003410FCB7